MSYPTTQLVVVSTIYLPNHPAESINQAAPLELIAQSQPTVKVEKVTICQFIMYGQIILIEGRKILTLLTENQTIEQRERESVCIFFPLFSHFNPLGNLKIPNFSFPQREKQRKRKQIFFKKIYMIFLQRIEKKFGSLLFCFSLGYYQWLNYKNRYINFHSFHLLEIKEEKEKEEKADSRCDL